MPKQHANYQHTDHEISCSKQTANICSSVVFGVSMAFVHHRRGNCIRFSGQVLNYNNNHPVPVVLFVYLGLFLYIETYRKLTEKPANVYIQISYWLHIKIIYYYNINFFTKLPGYKSNSCMKFLSHLVHVLNIIVRKFVCDVFRT